MPHLEQILRDSDYKLTQFTPDQIAELESRCSEKDGKGIYTECLVRKKQIKMTPEEIIRQLFILKLMQDYQYPTERLQIEHGVHFGREVKRADIVIMDKDRPTIPYIMVEVKKPKLKDGKEQLKSYCNATGATMGVWSNGEAILHWHRKDPNYFEEIPRVPTSHEKLSDVLTKRWTIQDLIDNDDLVTKGKSLKDKILDLEDEVLANAGVDVFEELFKLIFAKLYDEMQGGRDPKRHLEFRNYGETDLN
jgi:type I restriction enzyme M protein